MKILECSSRGDNRFSAMYAKLSMWGVYDSIENHYQLCKRFGEFMPRSWREAKGKRPSHIELNGRTYSVEYLSSYYAMLWCRYLDINPELVNYASEFDDFSDMFLGKAQNCQADMVRAYVKEGRESLWKIALPLWNKFSQ